VQRRVTFLLLQSTQAPTLRFEEVVGIAVALTMGTLLLSRRERLISGIYVSREEVQLA
jgi:hypothetical protein